MHPRRARWTSSALAVALVAGIVANAALAFIDEAGTMARLAAVALVAVGSLVPVGRQLVGDLAPAPWELFVSYGRRSRQSPEGAVPWEVLGLTEGDSLFNARRALGGNEDEIVPAPGDGLGYDDRRVWHRPRFKVSALIRRDQVVSLEVEIESDAKPVRVAVPRGVALGATTFRQMQSRGDRPPDRVDSWWYEGHRTLELRWTTGPEGTLALGYAVTRAPHSGDSGPAMDAPVARCRLIFESEIALGLVAERSWPTPEQLELFEQHA